MSTSAEDPQLGSISWEDEDSVNGSDPFSIVPSASLLSARKPVGTLYRACAQNDPALLQKVLMRRISKEEVMELDINGRNCLIIACSKGFVDIVYTLRKCRFLDVNHQDNEGNTALMLASQAGSVNITRCLLDHYPAIDTEIRDDRSFTALIKAAIAGKNEVLSALVMAGADLHAIDFRKGNCALTWALRTGHYDTVRLLRSLAASPRAEQVCDVSDWMELKKETHVSCKRRGKTTKPIIHTLRFLHDTEEGSYLDHVVPMTTSVHGHLVCSGCRPLCPSRQQVVGQTHLMMPDLIDQYSKMELEECSECHSSTFEPRRKAHAQSFEPMSTASHRRSMRPEISTRVASILLPCSRPKRNTIHPYCSIPRIKITSPPDDMPNKEMNTKKKIKETTDFLQLPRWSYKVSREERRKNKKEEQANLAKKNMEKREHQGNNNSQI